ncbi:hypothetical protein [Allomuricauda sp. R78024]|uniref:hypothetical protein n=1 Tax=Allomuricauda sp. R78024 TaxID=3093867 RepID=UPI0037C9A2B6
MKTHVECNQCKKPFSYSEGIYRIENPGAEEIRPIKCPYCGNLISEKATTTWWNIDKWSDEAIEKYNKEKFK